MKKIIVANPARNPGYRLKAKSRCLRSERYVSLHECRRLLASVIGQDHLVIRTPMQLGLRSEEVFAVRRDDVSAGALRIDEAIVEGGSGLVKSDARTPVSICCRT
jgi:hypothetical protein